MPNGSHADTGDPMELLITRARVNSSSCSRRRFIVAALPIFAFGFISLMCVCTSPAADQKPDPLPSTAELRKMFDDKQYQDLLAKLTRVLNLKGPIAKPYNHVELGLLRAETLMQLKQRPAAVAAYAQAVKDIDDTTEDSLAAKARATQVLIKRTSAYTFMPKTAPKGELPKAIDLLDVTLRSKAMEALLRDLRSELAPKVKVAKLAKSLPPIVEVIKSASDFRNVELVVTGKDADSQAFIVDLGTRALDLMNDAVKNMMARAQEIHVNANALDANPPAVAQGGVVMPTTYHKRGLDWRSTNDLKDIVATCGKIGSAAGDFGSLSKSLTANFKDVGDAADKTARSADETLRADYSGVFGGR